MDDLKRDTLCQDIREKLYNIKNQMIFKNGWDMHISEYHVKLTSKVNPKSFESIPFLEFNTTVNQVVGTNLNLKNKLIRFCKLSSNDHVLGDIEKIIV